MTLNKWPFIIASLCFCTMATARNFYVAPSGYDQADGSSPQPGPQGPFQTLARAQQAIRDLKKNSQFKEPVTVHIAGGTYQLQRPLDFDIRDSGFADRKIVWQGEKGTSIVSGGITLQNCAAGEGKIWSCPVAGLALDNIKYLNTYRKKGNIPGFELFVNEQRLHLARWPDEEWAHIKVPLNQKTSFSIFEQLPPLPNDLSHAQAHILAGNDWHDQYLPIAAINQERNEITLAGDTAYPLASGRRFYLQNIQSELNAPAEWFYDNANGRILFIPPEGVTPENIIVSSLPNLITVKGADHISFKNLNFKHSTGIAINISDANNLSLDGFEVDNVGGRAIEAVNSSNITVSNSHIHDTGEGGILVSGGDRKTLQSANNLVHNNHIHHFGKVLINHSPAIALGGVGSKVTHNLVEHGAGLAILIDGNDHLLEKNEIHHVCEQASDCGAIYSGRDWTYRGNSIRYNSLHDIYGYGLKNVDIAQNKVNYAPHDAIGVYLDDGVSDFNVVGNIFNHAGNVAIKLGGGRDNHIENNLINTDSYAIWVDNRWAAYNWAENRRRLQAMPYQSPIWLDKYPKLAQAMNHDTWPEGNTIRRNIMITTGNGRPLLHYQMPENSNILADNLVWSTAGQVSVEYDILDHLKKQTGASWQDWITQGVAEKGSIHADPCVSVSGNVVKFCASSPAEKIGFQALPTDIGLIK